MNYAEANLEAILQYLEDRYGITKKNTGVRVRIGSGGEDRFIYINQPEGFTLWCHVKKQKTEDPYMTAGVSVQDDHSERTKVKAQLRARLNKSNLPPGANDRNLNDDAKKGEEDGKVITTTWHVDAVNRHLTNDEKKEVSRYLFSLYDTARKNG
jgi:hypothetical protein